MKILIAPNSFKECAASLELAELINSEFVKRNVKQTFVLPVSDGGDGFLDVYKHYYKCEINTFRIPNCYNGNMIEITAAYDNASSFYILESAHIIGLKNIPFQFRNPLQLNSMNLGVLISKLLNNQNSKKIMIGLGGTGTTDLGLGLCEPFGLKLYDSHGKELKIIPENFQLVKKIGLPQKLNKVIEAVIDVSVPLYGRNGSAFVFSEQKGVTRDKIPMLDAGIKNIIRILAKDHNINFRNRMIGAAGGLCLGLSLISNLKIISSKQFLQEKLNVRKRIKESDLVITAEGRFDEQSFMKKATGIIVKEAIKEKKQLVIICGECSVDLQEYDPAPIVIELIKLMGSKEKALTQYKKAITLSIDKLSEYFPSLNNS